MVSGCDLAPREAAPAEGSALPESGAPIEPPPSPDSNVAVESVDDAEDPVPPHSVEPPDAAVASPVSAYESGWPDGLPGSDAIGSALVDLRAWRFQGGISLRGTSELVPAELSRLVSEQLTGQGWTVRQVAPTYSEFSSDGVQVALVLGLADDVTTVQLSLVHAVP